MTDVGTAMSCAESGALVRVITVCHAVTANVAGRRRADAVITGSYRRGEGDSRSRESAMTVSSCAAACFGSPMPSLSSFQGGCLVSPMTEHTDGRRGPRRVLPAHSPAAQRQGTRVTTARPAPRVGADVSNITLDADGHNDIRSQAAASTASAQNELRLRIRQQLPFACAPAKRSATHCPSWAPGSKVCPCPSIRTRSTVSPSAQARPMATSVHSGATVSSAPP
jgi:hypothetical protein